MNKYLAILFCWSLHAVVVTFVFYDDDTPIRTHFDQERYLDTTLYCALVAVVLTTFAVTAVSDPGRIKDAMCRKDSTQASSCGPGLTPTQIDPHCRFCTSCAMWQLLRSKHCRSCKACVGTYDHHCIWMGNCIGEKNHAYFWWFLFSETLLAGWSVYQIVMTLQEGQDLQESLQRNAFAIITGIMIIFLAWLPIALWAFHTYLLCANVTTWEFNRFDRISYLRGLSPDARPFSKGILSNLVLMCFGEGTPDGNGLIKWGDYYDAVPYASVDTPTWFTGSPMKWHSPPPTPQKEYEQGNNVKAEKSRLHRVDSSETENQEFGAKHGDEQHV